MTCPLAVFCILAFALGVNGAAFAQAPPPEGTLVETGKVPLQGDCGTDEIAPDTHQGNNANLSTWVCTGASTMPLTFTYTSGMKESCLYLDNLSTDKKTFFVPMRTDTEWAAFKRAVQSGELAGKVVMVYGCEANNARKDKCDKPVNLPAGRNGDEITLVSPKPLTLKTTYRCEATNGCGSWVVAEESGRCAVSGMCGSSAGVVLDEAPTTGLCNTGEPGQVMGDGPWAWTCTTGEMAEFCTTDSAPAP